MVDPDFTVRCPRNSDVPSIVSIFINLEVCVCKLKPHSYLFEHTLRPRLNETGVEIVVELVPID